MAKNDGHGSAAGGERQFRVVTSRFDWWAFALIVCVFGLLVLRRLGDSSLGYPDADRILMDGVFFRDFFHDLPLFDVYGYVTHYFAQYPALSIGYRPPFFPFVEGLFNTAFGVEVWSSRLALLAFGVAGLTALFTLIRRMFGGGTALAAAALLATTPFVISLSWYTMGEVPVLSMALITAFFYYGYTSTGKTSFLVLTALAAVLSVWTKQTALFLLLWIFVHQLSIGRLREQFLQRRVWLTVTFVVAALIPLGIITLWLGDQNLRQSIGMIPVFGKQAFAAIELPPHIAERLTSEVLLVHLKQIYQLHLEWPTLALVLVGAVWGILRRDRRIWFWLSYIIVVYVFFTYIKGQNARYPIFWIPAFLVLASVPLSYFQGRKPRGLFVYGLLLVGAVGWNIVSVWQKAPKYATGYDEAAEFVLAHSESPTVFFDGYNNGYFTFFMRALDPQRSMYVLRGDKLLSSTSIGGRNRLEVHAHDADDVKALLDRFGIQFVVVEDKNTIGIPIHGVLREVLKADERFELVKRIPVDTGVPSTRSPLEGVSLLIYEVRGRGLPKDGILELRLPVVGQTLRVPLRGWKERSIDN